MSCTHFSIIERSKLELLHSQGAGIRAIGRVLGRSAGAVSRELKRNESFGRYDAQETQQAYVYFADAYSSWQRGSKENANGWLREFFPKGHDFAKVSDAELQHALHLINNRPRKGLGWKSTHASFQNELLHLD